MLKFLAAERLDRKTKGEGEQGRERKRKRERGGEESVKERAMPQKLLNAAHYS